MYFDFFFNDTATTQSSTYCHTLSLHDALPIFAQHHGQRGHLIVAKAGRSVLRNPIVMSPLAGLGWWLTGIPLPQPAQTFVSLLGGAASPAALVAIGLFLAAHPLRQAATNFFVQALTAAKLVVHPALTDRKSTRLNSSH